jgi:hypothetical protein
MKRWWKWLLGAALALALIAGGLAFWGWRMAQRLEPFVREKTAQYLRERFDSEVEIGKLEARLGAGAPLRALLNKGRGATVFASGEAITVRHKGRKDLPPLLKLARFSFEADLGSLAEKPALVHEIRLEGLEVTIPPKGERPKLRPGQPETPPADAGPPAPAALIGRIVADGAKLSILPRDPKKAPLGFDLPRLRMESAGPGVAMKYDAVLTNAKPPGVITAQGTFGPWTMRDPAESPLTGDYVFANADLSVFKGIAGMLSSQGKFWGRLNAIAVEGVTETADFRLTRPGNALPLKTKFRAQVDGTNGNTRLQPVDATLGRTRFTATGDVTRTAGLDGRTVALDVSMSEGRLEDVLRLALKGDQPVMRGGVGMRVKLTLPPGSGEASGRLRLSGSFALQDARFTSAEVQKKIDALSQRGQGRPKDFQGEVPAGMEGRFEMKDGVIEFAALKFTVPGALVDVAGRYRFEQDDLDFRGKLKLEAKVSQTLKGWKRWVAKPLDPFFSKEGAGTLLKIAITGPRSNVQFGLDKKK